MRIKPNLIELVGQAKNESEDIHQMFTDDFDVVRSFSNFV